MLRILTILRTPAVIDDADFRAVLERQHGWGKIKECLCSLDFFMLDESETRGTGFIELSSLLFRFAQLERLWLYESN